MYDTILFDLDGTITDPKLGITKSMQYALDKFDIQVDTLDALDKCIGPPLKQSFMHFFSFTEEQSIEAIEHYRAYFRTKGIFENKMYQHIPELLNKLVSNNITLAIATSKPTVFAEKIIHHFDLSKYFQAIVGSNLDHTRSEKKEIIAHAMSTLHCSAATTIMVGDRKYDIIGAGKNNIASVGVLYGYGSREEITIAAPDFVAEEVTDLSGILLN